MSNIIDKRIRSQVFQDRLTHAMGERSESQSGLARKIGVDRSTISQLLTNTGARLPNAQVVAECAHALHVSADWLLGLSRAAFMASSVVRPRCSVYSHSNMSSVFNMSGRVAGT